MLHAKAALMYLEECVHHGRGEGEELLPLDQGHLPPHPRQPRSDLRKWSFQILQCNLPIFHPQFFCSLADFAITAKLDFGIKLGWFASKEAMIARWVVETIAYHPHMIWVFWIGLHLGCHAWIWVVHRDFVHFRKVKVN